MTQRSDGASDLPIPTKGKPWAVAASVVLATAGVYFLIGRPWAERIGYEFAGAVRPFLGLACIGAAVFLLWVDAKARRGQVPRHPPAGAEAGAVAPAPRTVVLYTREHCSLCVEAAAVLRAVAAVHGWAVWEEDVDKDPELAAKYGDRVPVGVIGAGEEIFAFKVDVARLRDRLAR